MGWIEHAAEAGESGEQRPQQQTMQEQHKVCAQNERIWLLDHRAVLWSLELHHYYNGTKECPIWNLWTQTEIWSKKGEEKWHMC